MANLLETIGDSFEHWDAGNDSVDGYKTNLKPKQIRFLFPESIEVQSAFYVYKELSLIAEVGGYVGLFLGYSVYQITDMFDMFFSSLKRKLSFKHVP